jgi:hypothetical protein
MISFENTREADTDFFNLSGILTYKEMKHTPLIAFIENNGDVNIKVIMKVKEVLELPDQIKIICQWKGEWRSDYFHFTVGQLKAAKLNREIK